MDELEHQVTFELSATMKRNGSGIASWVWRRLFPHNCLSKGTRLPTTTTTTFLSQNPNPLSHVHYTVSFHSHSSTSDRKSLTQKPRIGFYNINNLQDALNLFNRMLQTRPLPSVMEYNQLLGFITRMKHCSTVVSRYKQMLVLGISVDEYTMNTVINCYCHLNRVDFGFATLGHLLKHGGCAPNVTTFTTLIKGLFLEHNFAEAMGLFNKLLLLRENQIEPDGVMYGTVINGLCKAGNASMAIGLLRDMEKTRVSSANLVMYNNSIIDSLCKDRMVDDALVFFSEMIEKGMLPDVITYNSLIHGLCNFGRWKEAKRLLNEMVDLKFFPDVYSFNILVDAICKEGLVRDAESQMDEAMKAFNSIEDKVIEPDTITYNTLINGYCKQMKIDEAMNLLLEMPSKGLEPTIDTNTVNVVEAGQKNKKRNHSGEGPSQGNYKKFTGKCFICGKLGHRAKDCRSRKTHHNPKKKTTEVHIAEEDKLTADVSELNLSAVVSEINLPLVWVQPKLVWIGFELSFPSLGSILVSELGFNPGLRV
ncbi:pentatricopeptide repeat-containing protein At1g63150-like [Cornus florida]|uniref:pentatricopeptide repeat-containing protein At1g63150-like n=1 Tax=Cornus florida TaxID=4283 RepID=UPI00289DA1F6|nr:pentatricopeptide repeat-containing protein At1g63150-like [Cornus florida]